MKKILLLLLASVLCTAVVAQNRRIKELVADDGDSEVDRAVAAYDAQGRPQTIDYTVTESGIEAKTSMTVDYPAKTIRVTGKESITYIYTTNINGNITSMTGTDGSVYTFTYQDGVYMTKVEYETANDLSTYEFQWSNGNITRQLGVDKAKSGSVYVTQDEAQMDISYGTTENKGKLFLLSCPGDMTDYTFFVLQSCGLFGQATKYLPSNAHAVYTEGDETETDNVTLTYILDSYGYATTARSTTGFKMTLTYEDSTSTGITVPSVINGVEKSSAYYNLQGQRVSPSFKGLLLHGGKKVLVK